MANLNEYKINCLAMAIVNHTNEINAVDVATRQKNNDACFDFGVNKIKEFLSKPNKDNAPNEWEVILDGGYYYINDRYDGSLICMHISDIETAEKIMAVPELLSTLEDARKVITELVLDKAYNERDNTEPGEIGCYKIPVLDRIHKLLESLK